MLSGTAAWYSSGSTRIWNWKRLILPFNFSPRILLDCTSLQSPTLQQSHALSMLQADYIKDSNTPIIERYQLHNLFRTVKIANIVLYTISTHYFLSLLTIRYRNLNTFHQRCPKVSTTAIYHFPP